MIDLEQHVRAALQVEAEHDRLGRHDPGRDPARDRAWRAPCAARRVSRFGTASRQPIQRSTATIATILVVEKRSIVSLENLVEPPSRRFRP